jgi:hypothetical protein
VRPMCSDWQMGNGIQIEQSTAARDAYGHKLLMQSRTYMTRRSNFNERQMLNEPQSPRWLLGLDDDP